MTDKEYEQLMIRTIKGDTDALNKVEPEIRMRLEKEMENGNPFVTLIRAMFDPNFFDDDKSKEDFIRQMRNNIIE